VVAFGGLPGQDDPASEWLPFRDYLTGLTGRRRPRVCVLATATGDNPAVVEGMQERFADTCETSYLALFSQPNVTDPEDLLLSQDLIFVGGGSVANMLAVWRVHELDRIMPEAWRRGVVLSGVSAGAICWFESGTTDSFGSVLRPFSAGLAMLAGSYCPHYDAEPGRRPLYTSLVAQRALPPGYACDNNAGAHFTDLTLAGLVTGAPTARGYRVEPSGAGGFTEVPLESRLLPGTAA
jgi:peptidase E